MIYVNERHVHISRETTACTFINLLCLRHIAQDKDVLAVSAVNRQPPGRGAGREDESLVWDFLLVSNGNRTFASVHSRDRLKEGGQITIQRPRSERTYSASAEGNAHLELELSR